MRTVIRAAALAAALALALAACTAAPDGDPVGTLSPGDPTPVGEVDYKACIVSDTGGFDDRSLNQAGLDGLVRARDELGIDIAQAESQEATDFGPNIDSMVDQNCDLTIAVGNLLADATSDAAAANPDTRFAIIDQTLVAENIKPITFDTAEAAFLAGYLAAGYTTSGIVATYGGVPVPTVTRVMDGFADGVAYYNEVKGTDVRVLGWDKASQQGEFVGNYDDISAGRELARSLIDAGADVILPDAGPVGAGAAAAALETVGVVVIGLDDDLVETAPEYADVTLTSIVKQLGPAVFDVVRELVAGSFSTAAYVGTLENDGVALAPFHKFDDVVSDGLRGEIEQVRADIISGAIVVEVPALP